MHHGVPISDAALVAAARSRGPAARTRGRARRVLLLAPGAGREDLEQHGERVSSGTSRVEWDALFRDYRI